MTGRDRAAARKDLQPVAGNSPASSNRAARPGGRECGASSRRPQPGAWPPEGGHFPSLLFEATPTAQDARQRDEDRSFAPDLNLDQIVAAVAGDREERDLITTVLYGHLGDAGMVRYRQEVFRDLEDPALFGQFQRFAGLMRQVRDHLRQRENMRYRYQREGWLLDAAAIYCEAVRSLTEELASAGLSSRALVAFR